MGQSQEHTGNLDAPDTTTSSGSSRNMRWGLVPAKLVAVRRGQQLRAAES